MFLISIIFFLFRHHEICARHLLMTNVSRGCHSDGVLHSNAMLFWVVAWELPAFVSML